MLTDGDVMVRNLETPGMRPRLDGRCDARVARRTVAPVLLLLAAGAVGCGATEASQNEGEQAANSSYVKVVNVETRTVSHGPFVDYVRLTGSVEALQDVVLSAEESGAIQRILVEKGARVSSGQPIAGIDDQVVRAQLEEARALAKLAHERFERQRQLWEDENIGSEIAFLQTKYEAESAEARVRLLEARLARHTIRSPIAGVLDARYVDAGELVAPGTPVVRVLTVDRIKIVGGVPERFGPFVRSGGAALITFDVLPGRSYEGTIGFVGSAVDQANRTFPIEIVMDNPEGSVKPQMVANVRVATTRLDDVIVVPQDVVLRTETGYQAFVVEDRDGQFVAEAREVRLGPSFENRVVVEAGLEPGDRLVVKGHQLVDPGDRVQVVGEGRDR